MRSDIYTLSSGDQNKSIGRIKFNRGFIKRNAGYVNSKPDSTKTATCEVTVYGIKVAKVENGNGQVNVDFAILSANGKGYTVYLSETGLPGSFKLYSDVNYNAKGAHIKGLTNGKIYYAYISYTDAKGIITRSGAIMIKPSK